MRVLQSILNEAFHRDIALRMFPPEKVKARCIWAVGQGRRSEAYIATGQSSQRTPMPDVMALVDDIYFNGVYKLIAEIDPTPQKKYAPWIMRMWMKRPADPKAGTASPRVWRDAMAAMIGTLFLEDMGRVGECLKKFEGWKTSGMLKRLQKRLPAHFSEVEQSYANHDIDRESVAVIDRRMSWMRKFSESNFDINVFGFWTEFEDTIGYIERLIEEDPEIQASRRQKQQADEQAMIEAGAVRLLFNDDTWKVVELFNVEAAKVYGRHTRWCTAADEMNAFNDYVPRGRLFVIINKPKNERWQFWASLAATQDRFNEMLSDRIADWMYRQGWDTNDQGYQDKFKSEFYDEGNILDMLEEFIEECVQFMDERDELGWQVHIPEPIWQALRSQVPYAVDMFRKWQRDD